MEDPSNIIMTCRYCSERMYPNKVKLDFRLGDFVKIRFLGNDGLGGTESMWVKVTRRYKDDFEGILSNDPVLIQNLKNGDVVRFKKEEVLDIYSE